MIFTLIVWLRFDVGFGVGVYLVVYVGFCGFMFVPVAAVGCYCISVILLVRSRFGELLLWFLI